MRELVLLLLVLFAVQAHAKPKDRKQPLKLAPSGQKAATTEDPGSATRLLYEDPRNQNSLTAGAEKKGPKVEVKHTCTDNMGMSYKQGDSGYDGCMRTFNTATPPAPGDKRPQSLGISFGN
jgi:hypothetical protein